MNTAIKAAQAADTYDLLEHIAWTDVIRPKLDDARRQLTDQLVEATLMPAGAMDQVRVDVNQVGLYSALPSTSGQKAGNRYKCTDSGYDFIFDGSAWKPFWEGALVTIPPTSWTADNQGSSTLDTTYGYALAQFTPKTGSITSRGYYRSAPSTPYTVTAMMRIDTAGYFTGEVDGRKYLVSA